MEFCCLWLLPRLKMRTLKCYVVFQAVNCQGKKSMQYILRCFRSQPHLTMNDELCRSLYLNCPLRVLCSVDPPHLPPRIWEIWMTSEAWRPSLPSKESLVLFLPDLWCQPGLGTCDILQLEEQPLCILHGNEKQGLLDHSPSDITLKSADWIFLPKLLSIDSNILKTHHVFNIFMSCCLTGLHLMALPDLQTFGLVFC